MNEVSDSEFLAAAVIQGAVLMFTEVGVTSEDEEHKLWRQNFSRGTDDNAVLLGNGCSCSP